MMSEAAEAVTGEAGGFAGLVARLVTLGWERNPCNPACPGHGGGDHAHLRDPSGGDCVTWADGRWTGFDLTLPSGPGHYVPIPVPGGTPGVCGTGRCGC
jgi:hypothetical protein